MRERERERAERSSRRGERREERLSQEIESTEGYRNDSNGPQRGYILGGGQRQL